MDQKFQNRIKKNLVFIKENLTQIGRVMDKLIEADLISMEEKAEIMSDKTFDSQCHTLIELMMKRGGFPELVEALKMSGNNHVAQKLMEPDRETNSSTKTSEKNFQVDVEKELARLSKGDSELKKANREDTILTIDESKDEIIQLIKDRELHRMRYDELMKKYNKLKAENKDRSDDIKSLSDEIETLNQRLRSKQEECKNHVRETDVTSAQVPKMATKSTCMGKAVDDVDGPLLSCITTDDKDRKLTGLLSEINDQKTTIEDLKGENEHLENLVVTLEDTIDELKELVAEKDDKIMKLRNDLGKLKLYVEAGKLEREKLTQSLRKEMDKSREQTAERFDGLESKLELVLQLMNNGKIQRNNYSDSTGGMKQATPRNVKKTNKKNGR